MRRRGKLLPWVLGGLGAVVAVALIGAGVAVWCGWPAGAALPDWARPLAGASGLVLGTAALVWGRRAAADARRMAVFDAFADRQLAGRRLAAEDARWRRMIDAFADRQLAARR